MTEIEKEIEMIDFVAFQAEECLEYSEDYKNYEVMNKTRPLCQYLRILRNDEHKMQKFLELSIHKYDIFKTYDKYQELEKKNIEIKYYHHLEILATLCDRTATYLIEIFNMFTK